MLRSAAAGTFPATVLPSPSAHSTQPASSPVPRLGEISRIVDQVAASWHSPVSVVEHRRWQRIHYDRPAILSTLNDRTGELADGHKIISGRDISPSGFSFTHREPLPCRRAIVTFAFEEPPWEAIILRLSWCRFMRSGIYQSGGKFLGRVDSPLLYHFDLDGLPFA